MSVPLAVTVFTGSPGTDGTRVFEQVLRGSDGLRLTAIVPKRGRKRKRVSVGASVLPTTERLVRLGEGCACCTVRGDLMTKIRRIAEEGSADHVLIQTVPGSDLSTVAKTFTVADGSGAVLSDVARIRNMVTVIDARRFAATLKGASARKLVEGIELANVVVLEGGAGLSEEEKERVGSTIEALNRDARITRSDDEGFSFESLQSDEPFDLAVAQNRSTSYATEDESNATSFVVRFDYQARRPFHPTRLHEFVSDPSTGVLRAKGSFWVATRPELAATLDIAGGSRNTSVGGMWWAAVSEDQRPNSSAFRKYMEEIWDPDFGDRHHDLSLIGIGIDEEGLRTRLDHCLLTDEELEDPKRWASMPDPFRWPKNH